MSDISMVAISPSGADEEGDVIDLPENIGRVDTFYDSRPARGVNFEMTVVGSGETEQYVLLKATGTNPTLEDGAQVLASNVERLELWYAVPLTAYGGSE